MDYKTKEKDIRLMIKFTKEYTKEELQKLNKKKDETNK